MKNISTQKERILYYLDKKGISKNKFYISTGISNGTLDKKSGLTSDSIEKFYSVYNDINPEWLLTGKGEMLKSSLSNEEKVKRIKNRLPNKLSMIETIGIDAFLEKEIEDGREYIQYDVPLLENLIRTNRVKPATDYFSNIQGDLFMLTSFLSHYDLQIGMIDTLRKYRNKEVDLESVKMEFKQKLEKELELYKLIEPYKETISELYNIVSDFNDKHDRLYHIDE